MHVRIINDQREKAKRKEQMKKFPPPQPFLSNPCPKKIESSI
jgi:hypothetical protein